MQEAGQLRARVRPLESDMQERVAVSSLLMLRELQQPGKPDAVGRIISRFSRRPMSDWKRCVRQSLAAVRKISSAQRTRLPSAREMDKPGGGLASFVLV